ncbi:MAG: hypothetical protein GF308_07575 [Candidatus Heimdallarchaeota archaeon]|nr:hypothetical protein [Candidatus Heimdallarchaeota archaeon]
MASFEEKLEKAVKTLIAKLDPSVDVETRKAAIIRLGTLNAEEAVPYLLEILQGSGDQEVQDDDSELRQAAAEALGNICTSDGISALEIALDNENNPNVLKKVIESLGTCKAVTAIPDIVDLLKNSEDEQIRIEAVYALAETATSPALEGIIWAMNNDPSPTVRSTATTVLGQLGLQETTQDLLFILKNDKDGNVRKEAVYSLGKIENMPATDELLNILSIEKDPQVRAALVRNLGEHNDKAEKILPVLIKVYKEDKDSSVQFWVEDSIEKLGAVLGYESIEKIMEDY